MTALEVDSVAAAHWPGSTLAVGTAGEGDYFLTPNCTLWCPPGVEGPDDAARLCNCTAFSNLTSLSLGDDEGLYDVPTEVIVLLSIFYGTISAVAVMGNSLVIWIVASSRSMQNVTNYYIANLALADIVIGLFAIPFQFQAALLQRWILPYFMCPFCPFVQVLTVTVSVFTLTAIAVDRHRAILNPLSARPSKLRAKISIAVIWLASALLATPMGVALRVNLVADVAATPMPAGRPHVKPFCQNMNMSKEALMTYRVVLWVLQYLVPLCVITFVYVRMALRLWGSTTPGTAQDSRDANIMRNKKKVIKMLVIVVALFAVCWFPLQTYNILQDVFPKINSYKYINIIFFCCDWLAMSNSCYNPFIYGIYNEKFKREFRQRCPILRRRRRSKWVPPDSLDTERGTPLGSRSTFQLGHFDWRRSSRNNAPRFGCYPPPPGLAVGNGLAPNPDTLYRPYAARLAASAATADAQKGRAKAAASRTHVVFEIDIESEIESKAGPRGGSPDSGSSTPLIRGASGALGAPSTAIGPPCTPGMQRSQRTQPKQPQPAGRKLRSLQTPETAGRSRKPTVSPLFEIAAEISDSSEATGSTSELIDCFRAAPDSGHEPGPSGVSMPPSSAATRRARGRDEGQSSESDSSSSCTEEYSAL